MNANPHSEAEGCARVAAACDCSVTDFIALVDRIVRYRANADAAVYVEQCGRTVGAAEHGVIEDAFLAAYRRQCALSLARFTT